MRGLVRHVGRGRYESDVARLLREQTGQEQINPYVERIERALGSSQGDREAASGAD